jgi:2-polyprenyl-3-methyl-5-hydroxy-6-metoxy-1,4-benzoquinol methylase
VEAVERLTLEEAQEPTLLASTHVHRYELAAELCQGLRVLDLACGSGYGSRILRERCPEVTGIDRDEPTIARAREKLGREGLGFEVADAHEVLRRQLGDSFDAIVMLESLEHLDDPDEALAALRRHAEEGLRLIVSVPNSRTLGEDNPHHITDYGYDEAKAAFAAFPDARFLYQFHAEGTLIRGAEQTEANERLQVLDEGEPEYATHFIVLVNLGAGDEVSARMRTAVAASSLRYMRALERANAELRRSNARLSREKLGVADSAAASLLGQIASLRQERDELLAEREEQRRKAEAEQELNDWIEELHLQIADLKAEVERRDAEHRRVVEEMEKTRAWRLGTAYWRARDRVKASLHRG